MRFGSVCSGIEAASVAWNPLGWHAAWFSEIEPYPCSALAHHYPDVANLGDMTTIAAKIAQREIEAPDVFCGGTPCQSFSIAGARRSLDDKRGNLSLEFCRIANAIDDIRQSDGQQPCIVFWENVPGVLSTSDNAFGCFLSELSGASAELKPTDGRWSNAGLIVGPRRTVAWRILDAQYFGLAQRRKRVFVISSARTDIDIGQVLFEFDGVQRTVKPRRETGQSDTRTTAVGVDADSGNPTFTRELTHTLKTTINEAVFAIDSLASNSWKSSNPHSGIHRAYISRTLDTSGTNPMANQGGNVIVAPFVGTEDVAPTLRANAKQSLMSGSGYINSPIAISIQGNIIDRNHGGAQGLGISTEDISYTLTTTDRHAVAFNQNILWQALRYEGVRIASNQDTVPTLTSYMGTGGNNVPLVNVRRLTPRECERLQGFPDDYTLVPHRGSLVSDAPRYKALGNSWPVPVVRWIGERIMKETP